MAATHALLDKPSDVQIKTIAIDPVASAGRCRALVRLQPPPAPGPAATEAAPSAGTACLEAAAIAQAHSTSPHLQTLLVARSARART